MSDHKKIQTQNDWYIDADVHRETLTNQELNTFANYNLKRLGAHIVPNPSWVHLGSFATHIYAPEKIESFMFMHQQALGDIPETVASKALEDLKGTLMGAYGRGRSKRRSGF